MFDTPELSGYASPGAALDAALVSGAEGLDADALLDRVIVLEKIVSCAQAAQAACCAAFAALRPAPKGSYAEFAADELACALSLTRAGADARLDLAVTLTQRLPGTLRALGRGDIDLHKARALAEVTEPLSPEQARQVEEQVLPRASQQTGPQLRQSARRAVLRADPDGAVARHQQRKADRRVEFFPLEDGMAALNSTLPAPQAAAIYHRLDAIARNAAPDDPRSMDARRADALTDLLLADNPGPAADIAARVHLTVPATTLAGSDRQPGDLAGYGPITAEAARDTAATGLWRRLVTDPFTGALLDFGRTTYRPPAHLADHVRARDLTCRFPGCRHPAHSCDLDHTTPYPHGPTAATNLGALCRHHHRLKHNTTWKVTQDQDGVFHWTSPTGRQYTTTPEPQNPPPTPPTPPPPPTPPKDPADDPPPF